MINLSVFVLCFASTAVLTAVVIQEEQHLCSDLEFSCRDGSCISLSLLCDGLQDCDDGGDEAACFVGSSSQMLGRSKRQATSACSSAQWQCRDGSCIGFDGKCDGVVNCADGSDETHPLCRRSKCQSNWFRCSYGACVDGTAPCNGVQECADNSDELLPVCRNEVSEVRGQFKCLNGQTISAALHCDGTADCADGSDETVRACAGKTCSEYLFQCAYGACVDSGSDCNGVVECYDGSDESDELCNRTTTARPLPRPTPAPPVPTPSTGGACVLPPFPKHGSYVVSGVPDAKPGQAFDVVALNITCNKGYNIMGKKDRICFNGIWSESIPNCIRFCQLRKDPSVEYKCLLGGDSEGVRECNAQEPAGTVVRPECKSPNYYSPQELKYMRCDAGSWTNIPRCVPGLKHGTNITILIRDKDDYEIHIGKFQYTSHNNDPNTGNNNPTYVDIKVVNPTANPHDTEFNVKTDNGPNSVNTKALNPINKEFEQVTPVVAEYDYDIDVEDWRMLGSNSLGHARNMNGGDRGSSVGHAKRRQDFNVHNTRVVDRKPVRNVYDRDGIVFRHFLLDFV